jgi:hypothetical protein
VVSFNFIQIRIEELFQKLKTEIRTKGKRKQKEKKRGQEPTWAAPGKPAGPAHQNQPDPAILSPSLTAMRDPPVISLPAIPSLSPFPVTLAGDPFPLQSASKRPSKLDPIKAPALLSRPSLFPLQKTPPGCSISSPELTGAAARHRRF